MDSGKKRRVIGIGALLLGLGAAWWTANTGRHDVQVSLLLTHLPMPGMDDGDGRSRLVRVELQIPTEPGGAIGWRHMRKWRRGEAPEASAPIKLELPKGVSEIGVRCTFSLDNAGTRHQTTGVATIDDKRDDLQVVDIGGCRKKAVPPPG